MWLLGMLRDGHLIQGCFVEGRSDAEGRICRILPAGACDDMLQCFCSTRITATLSGDTFPEVGKWL